jgi:hypothetical protein
MKQYFAQHGIKVYSVYSQFKASVVERWNRTLKTKMWRWFTHNHTDKWLDYLPKLVNAYNHSIHRSIGRAPISVNRDNEMAIWLKNEDQLKIPTIPKHLKVGDHVRISKVKRTFDKGYLPNWTEEVFVVKKILPTKPIQVKIEDYNGEEIKGSFYLSELQVVEKPKEYIVERIIQEKGVGKRKQFLVKWKGYPESMNSWVTQDQIRKL